MRNVAKSGGTGERPPVTVRGLSMFGAHGATRGYSAPNISSTVRMIPLGAAESSFLPVLQLKVSAHCSSGFCLMVGVPHMEYRGG